MATRTVSVNLVANIGQYVSGMNKAAGATMRLGETSSASTKKAQGGFDAASKGALVMGAAVVGGLGMAISKSMDFEKSMSAVSAATGATVGTLGDLREAAMKAGADTQYSATEAADAITEMAKAGVSAKDIMGGGLKGALALAAAGQLDVADAAGIASVAMTQFSLTGKDLPHVADLLAAGAGKAMGSVGDLGAALNQSGLIASAAGLSIEETTGTLSAFASAGLIGSDAGTSFKTMLQALQAPSGKAAELMSDLGINMYDTQGNMLGVSDMAGVLHDKLSGLTEEQRNSALATIFGSDAVRAANVLYKEGAAGIAEWTNKVNDQGYAAEQARKLNDNLAGDLERLGGSFDTLLISLGSGAQGPLRELVQALGGIVDGVTWVVDAFSSIPGPVKVALATLAAVKLLGGPMQTGFKMASVAVDVFTASLKNMGGPLGIAKAGAGGLLGMLGGPWGIALTGAAVGVSLLVDWLGKGGKTTSDFASAQGTLRDALAATNGVMDESVRRTAAKVLQDQHLLDFTDTYGVKSQDMVGYVLGEADAHDRVTGALQRYRDSLESKLTGDKDADAVTRGLIGAVDQHKAALDGLAGSTTGAVAGEKQIAEAAGLTGGAMAASTAQTEEAAKAQEQWLQTVSESLQSFVNPLGAYKELLAEKKAAEQEAAQATADSTKSSKDSWKDYVDDVDVSLGELAGRLEQQLTEQANWRTNIAKIAQWAGADVANYLTQMGTDGAAIVAKMADGTTADAKRMATDITKTIQSGSLNSAAAMDQGNKVMAAVGKAGAKATVVGISDELGIGADVVARILGQYGVSIATGINPVLSAIGKKTVTIHQQRDGRRYIGPNAYADGGYTGPGGKYTPAGVVHAGEFVFPQEAVNRLGVDFLGAMAGLPGYAGGGFVSVADVPRPPSSAPFRSPISTAMDGAMGKEYDEVTSWLTKALEPKVSYSGAATAGSGALVAFGHMLQRMGARVSEHPAFGGVHPVHVRGSKHYQGKAIDVNTRPGTSALEQRELAPMAAMARKAGFQTIFMAPGHYNHLHVASYKTGTPYVPKDGYAYLHQGERVVPKEQNLRSREFSGVGGRRGVGGSVNVAVQARVFVGNREITDIARVEAEAVVVGALTGQHDRAAY